MMNFLTETSNLTAYLQQFINKSVEELMLEQGIITNAKSKNYILSIALASSYKGKNHFMALLEHENLHLKTIQLKDNGKPKEAMSFPPFDFKEICNEVWETSKFKKYIDGSFLFFVFKKERSINYLKYIFLWKMPEEDKITVRETWNKTRMLIINGSVFKKIEDDKVITRFPAESETRICHVRPHGKNGIDLKELPFVDKTTGYKFLSKQSFWFNHSYLEEIIHQKENMNNG